MPNKITRLETKLQEYQEKEKNWKKEQNASIQFFKEQKTQIENLTNDLNTQTQKNQQLIQKSKELVEKSKIIQLELTQKKLELKTEKELNINLINKYSDLENQNLKLVKELIQKEEKLLEKQQKNELLENQISDLDLIIENKENKINEINLELKNTRENNYFLKNLGNKIENEKEIEWGFNKEKFIQILTNNFSNEEIKEKWGNIYSGWLEDNAFEILTKKEKQKLKKFEELNLAELPENWKEQLNNLAEWNNYFQNQKPNEINNIIQDFRIKFPQLVEKIFLATKTK